MPTPWQGCRMGLSSRSACLYCDYSIPYWLAPLQASDIPATLITPGRHPMQAARHGPPGCCSRPCSAPGPFSTARHPVQHAGQGWQGRARHRCWAVQPEPESSTPKISLHLQELQALNKSRPKQLEPLIPKVAGSALGAKAFVNFTDQGVCPGCKGAGHVVCKPCSGSGWLSKGGYNKRNPIPKDVINSKWSAMQETIGWRHFRVIQQRKSGNLVFLRMQASCDPNAQIWVNREALRDRGQWAAGWLQRSELLNTSSSSEVDADAAAAASAATDGVAGSATAVTPDAAAGNATTAQPSKQAAKLCRSCAGTGKVVCKKCDASGVALINL